MSQPVMRLLKVIVQPVVVLDDGETLTEQKAQPMEVAAADLDGYPAKLREQIAIHNGPPATP